MIYWEPDLWLITPEEFNKLPDGFELKSILGDVVIKGKDYIDQDTRGGFLAFGSTKEKLQAVLGIGNGN